MLLLDTGYLRLIYNERCQMSEKYIKLTSQEAKEIAALEKQLQAGRDEEVVLVAYKRDKRLKSK